MPLFNTMATSAAATATTTTTDTQGFTENEAAVTNTMHHVKSISGVQDFQLEAEKELAEEKEVQTQTKTSTAKDDGEDGLLIINCCSESAGAVVLFATDEWFAAANNLLRDENPSFDETAYCEQGKVMDGWETRRRREAGHDWCVIKCSHRTAVRSIEIDTAYFTGNHVPEISLEIADMDDCARESEMVAGFPGAVHRLLHGCVQGTGCTPDQVAQAEKACRSTSGVEWKELLPKTPLKPGYQESRFHHFKLPESIVGTHIRVNYFPDGGVARLRVFGSPLESPRLASGALYAPISTGPRCTVVSHTSGEPLPSQQFNDGDDYFPEVSCAEHGGVGITCSNQHYGSPANLIRKQPGVDMGDGWETARHPERPGILVKDAATGLVDSPLSDWCILKLGATSEIKRIILDTKHFRGNYPESVQVEGSHDGLSWFPLIPRGRMAPDSEHLFEQHQIFNTDKAVSHIRVSIYPDGGISRVRVYGSALQ